MTGMDRRRLEALLEDVARQLVERGEDALSGLDRWGSGTVCVQVRPEGVEAMLGAGACRVGTPARDSCSLGDLAACLDHTLLRPDATIEEIDRLCAEAREHRFATVCVNGTWVRRSAEILAGSEVGVCCVVGFPLGASAPEVKAFEAERAIRDGACEIDMVLNVGALRSGDDEFVRRDVELVASACHALGARLKVILETCLLTDGEKVRACRAAKAAGADFVKTSTGFSTGGATVADVELMRRAVGPVMGVKAAGGVRDSEGARAMIEAGATRIGASASVEILRGGSGSAAY